MMKTLLLPGMDGTGRLFTPLMRHLSPKLDAQVIGYPSDQILGYQQLLHSLVVPDEPFAVVAESFSGPLGILLATKYPEKIRALVLVATFISNPSRLAKWLRPLIHPMLFPVKLPVIALRFGLLGKEATDDDVSELKNSVFSNNPEVLVNRLQEVVAIDVTSEFAATRVPMLYIAGKNDRLVGIGCLKQMQRLRPDMEIQTLEAPHLVLQSKPIEAARLISQFLVPKMQ